MRVRLRAAAATAAALVAAFVLAAPAAAGERQPHPAAASFDVTGPAPPVRDVVLERPGGVAARAIAQASATRYPVNDGKGRTVAIGVSNLCEVACTAAEPQQIADFLGTVIHGGEMNRLSVDLVTRPGRWQPSAGPGRSRATSPRARGW